MRLTTRAADAAIVTRVATLAQTATPNVFSATLSTNSDVRRAGYTERLGRWNAFPARVPLLDSHRRESVESVVGFADNIRSENGAVVADLHISETRGNIATLMREGALNSVSIGFSAESWRDSTEGGERVRVGEGLTLREASVVVIGADPGARMRGGESTADQIRTLAETLRVPSTVAEELVTRGVSFEDARGELVRAASARNPRVDGRSAIYSVTDTLPADHARALGQALAARLGARNEVHELGRARIAE